MRLTSLHLSNVRNYARLELEPAQGLNVFVGRNAQGKSNLLEAISLLGTGKSFRTSRERDLIREGFELATVGGEARVRAGTVRLGCAISATPRGTRKAYTLNGRSVRYARFLGSLRVVTFVPSDLQLVIGPPAVRRAFLNAALAQERPAYYHELARYHKALAQKGALLRADAPPDSELLAVYDHTLVEAGTQIVLARAHYVEALGARAGAEHRRWSGSESLELRYRPAVPFKVRSQDAIASAFGERLRETSAQERARRVALVGPHRDDLEMLIDGVSLAPFGSQGQQRTAVLALKVAEYGVMLERSGEAPLLLLDDVLSELDAERARAFMKGVGTFEQAFITATHVPDDLPQAKLHSIQDAVVSAL